MNKHNRPSWDDYFINVAWVISSRSNCLRRSVGALIVVDRRIVSTGYNGTPFGVSNCNEGGCPRCASEVSSLMGYDWCLCVHAEQNTIALAARQGTSTDRASLYVTSRPCFGCLKEVVQAGIHEIVYDQHIVYNDDLEDAYQMFLKNGSILMRQHPYSTMHPLPFLSDTANKSTASEESEH